jgi:hypothetical protein
LETRRYTAAEHAKGVFCARGYVSNRPLCTGLEVPSKPIQWLDAAPALQSKCIEMFFSADKPDVAEPLNEQGQPQCFVMLTTGLIGEGQTFIHDLRDELLIAAAAQGLDGDDVVKPKSE